MPSLFRVSVKRIARVVVFIIIFIGAPCVSGLTLPQQSAPANSPELAEASKLAGQIVDLYNKGRYDEALPLAKRSLELRQQVLDAEHPLVGEAYQNLASVQFGRKNYGEARSLYKRALKILEKAYGPEGIQLALALDGLGWLDYADSNLGQAESMFQRALAIREKALGPDRMEVAQSAYLLAEFYEQTEQHAKAVSYYLKAAAINEKLLGPHDEQLAKVLDKCACALIQEHKTKEAGEMQARARKVRLKGESNDEVPSASHSVSGAVLQGSATVRVEPVYPLAAKNRRISGVVVVEVTVNESGEVINAAAVCGPNLLREASVEAARKWRFTPTRLNGVPVKVIGSITFNFHM